ncbi:hypothetical protein [Wolbachia endosymbiont (group A) of Myopa testacea]|uniref:hypothetical protein n=1 Tax=Wolbachia endosymbiont (group A) of Myopa testacea TaxID=3066148 RepID=UPI00334045E9
MDMKELVNAFNLNNYFSDKINTNFTVEGKKIVGLFVSGTNTKEYLQRIGEEIIKRHYLGGREVAATFYNLNYFPFVNNGKEKDIDKNVKKVELTDSTNNEVIHNLKVHFANEFEGIVGSKVATRLQKEVGITKEEAREWMEETVKMGAIGSSYLYCIAFSDEYLKRRYDSETFEFFKQAYIKEFNSRLKECHVKRSGFYEYKDDMLYIKDVSDKVVKSVTEYVKKEVAFDFRTPGSKDSKVENFKDVLGDCIFELIEKSINAYDYDVFTDKKKIENGNDFVLVPLTKRYSGQLEFLKHKDMYRINAEYQNLISDIRGKTADPDITNSGNPIYAISNKGITQLLPKIMQYPIAYSERNGRFEFVVDPENFKRRGSSRFSSTVNSPTHAGQSRLRTPPNKRKADSGYDSNSPPKPKDSVAHSSSGVPGSLFGQPRVESRQGSETERKGKCQLYNSVSLPGPAAQLNSIAVSYGVSGPSSSVQSVGAAQNVRAGTSASFQPMDHWSLPVFYAQSSDISVPRFQPPTQLSSSGASSLKGANESMSIGNSTWYLPSSTSFLTTRNDSMSSSLGVFADSPSVKGKESIFSVEPEKQQVTDKSDRESSDECSKAKLQKSESPKKHRGGLQSTIKSLLSSLSKLKQHGASLKRFDVGRDTMHSSVSDSGGFVTEKPPLSERSASERKAKSNPPSKVTSPVHSTINGSISGLPSQGTTVVESNSALKSQKRLDPDQREELLPFLSPELRKKLDSNSFFLGKEQHLYLMNTLSEKSKIKKSFGSQEENLRRSVNAQLPSSDNLSSEKVNRDSSFCSIGSASPAVPHKGSVSSELKHPQQVKHMSEALGK